MNTKKYLNSLYGKSEAYNLQKQMTKTYYLALNRQTHQYFIGYSVLKPWYSFRYEHKTLENAGDYKDYIYYEFDNLDNLFYALDKNLNILNKYAYQAEPWALLNKQINYRKSLNHYLTSRREFGVFTSYGKTDRGYVFELI